MIAIIAAMTRSGVIGKDNDLPWKISDDLKNFKKLTSGNTVIMGRKTFDSIGKSLPNRNNIVLSRNMEAREGLTVCSSIGEALQKAEQFGKDVFIIGGSRIYKEFLSIADTMFLSHVKEEYEGDTFFPEFDPNDWEVKAKQDFKEFELVTYRVKR